MNVDLHRANVSLLACVGRIQQMLNQGFSREVLEKVVALGTMDGTCGLAFLYIL